MDKRGSPEEDLRSEFNTHKIRGQSTSEDVISMFMSASRASKVYPKASVDPSEGAKRRWFILGCCIVAAGFGFLVWAFALGEINQARKFLLLYILPITVAVAAGCFSGSLKVSGPYVGFGVAASSGWAVWFLATFLLSRIPTSTPENRPLVDTPAFEVQENTTSFDLTGWRKVSQAEQSSKIFKSLTSTDLLLRRLRKEVDFLPHRISYSTLIEPEIECPTHSAALKPVPGEFTESTTPWDIKFDVAHEPLFDEFSLRYKVSVWNAFRGETSEWAAVTVSQPTRQLKIIVHFPLKKPFKSYTLYAYLRRDKSKRELFLDEAKVINSADKTDLTWVIENPHVAYIYRIDWEW